MLRPSSLMSMPSLVPGGDNTLVRIARGSFPGITLTLRGGSTRGRFSGGPVAERGQGGGGVR